MTFRNLFGLLCATGAAGALIGAPSVAAEPACPDAEVIFARGTGETPGVGGVGQAFVDSVRNQAGGRSVGVYPVNYPASGNFNDRLDIVRSVTDGVRDAESRIQTMAAACPDTRLILGGYSQGAAVGGFTTAPVAPPEVPTDLVPPALPADVADNVAAVVLFGLPSEQFLRSYNAPAVQIGPAFTDKTLELCARGDTICEGAFGGSPTVAHGLYPFNGQVSEGAAYAVGRI